jgi:hypothetical protein
MRRRTGVTTLFTAILSTAALFAADDHRQIDLSRAQVEPLMNRINIHVEVPAMKLKDVTGT